MASHKSKKRKTTGGSSDRSQPQSQNTFKPSAVFKARRGRQHTLSIALPGSVVANAQTHDSKTALAGQIARACAVFCVDEVVIFDDGQAQIRPPERGGYTAYADPNFFLHHILSYLETPPHLRKQLFPMHPDLRTAGSLPSLDMPHHMRSDEDCPYREGVVMEPSPAADIDNPVSAVECGLEQRVAIPLRLESGTRVTLKMESPPQNDYGHVGATAVSPEAPREEAGYYWGYGVRQAASLSEVFTECPYDGGYDVSIGTSERGGALESLLDQHSESHVEPTWKHMVIVFGGLAGLEAALHVDEKLKSVGVEEAGEVFDHWINLLPGQGSRTIRTEEAIWIGLTALRPLIQARESS